MSYDFSFSGKTLSLVLAGSAFVGIMLFIAGLLVGTNWKAEPNAATQIAVKQTVAEPTPEPTAVPREPVTTADLSTPQEVAATSPAEAASGAPSPDRQAHGSVVSVNRQREQAPAAAAAAAAPPNDAELRVVQEAEPAAASESAESPAFSVQLGAFASESDAHELARQLQKKGYAAVILAVRDDKSRWWHVVRIGAYANKTEAAQAASSIAGREKITAVVRPFGSL